MAAIEAADRAPGSNVVNEDIAPHELVYDNVGTGLVLVDGSDSDQVSGIAMEHESGQWVHDHDEDTSSLVYSASDNERASYGGYEDGAVIRPLSVEESTSGVTSSPSISEGDIVGVPDTTAADGPDSAGHIVEEGYSNDENDDASSTTFNRTNGNFVPIGRAVSEEDVTSFDSQVRVQVDKSL